MASVQIGEGGATAAHRALLPLAPEDESEWEYEYSTTETETFYVTLDLSTADFTAPHRNVISNIRTDYHDKPLTEAERGHHSYNELGPNGGDVDDDQGQEVQQRNPSRAAEGRDLARNSAEPESAESSEKVQIMELHSPNPVISYKGRVYQGQWSRHVGTELLMTRHDEENPLPALRHLDNGVDLLAASCARITVTQKELERKNTDDTEQNARLTVEERDALSKIPKPETKPSLARTSQANFLARLIALKKRKGERDEVPVLVNGHVRDLWVKGSHRGRGRGRGRSRGRRRGKSKGLGALHQDIDTGHRPTLDSIAELPDSTPTPRHWDDLNDNANNVSTDGSEGGGGGSDDAENEDENENAMEVDEGSNESEFSEEGSIAEEENDQYEDGSGGQSDDEDSDGDEMDVDED